MKALILLTLFSVSAFAKTDYKCSYPELSRGKEQRFTFRFNDDGKTGSLLKSGKFVNGCKNVALTEDGDVSDYGEATATLNCGGKKVILERDYDETFLDVSELKMNFGDDRYSC